MGSSRRLKAHLLRLAEAWKASGLDMWEGSWPFWNDDK